MKTQDVWDRAVSFGSDSVQVVSNFASNSLEVISNSWNEDQGNFLFSSAQMKTINVLKSVISFGSNISNKIVELYSNFKSKREELIVKGSLKGLGYLIKSTCEKAKSLQEPIRVKNETSSVQK